MAEKNESIYDIAFKRRAARISELENRCRELEDDTEYAVREYVKAGGDKKLRAKKKPAYTTALDGLR